MRFDLRDKRAWKGRLRLVVIPIRFSDYYHMEYDWKHPISTVCAKTANLQQAIDICDYIGNSDIFAGTTYRHVNQHNRVNRLYFSVSEFKPSQYEDVQKKNFDRLKNYIRMASENEGSPVICSVSSKKYRYKTFICNKNKSGKKKVCPFSFKVQWDKFGFYIHLLQNENQTHSVGSAWHCCCK